MTHFPLNKSTKCRLASLARSSFHGVKTLTVTLSLLGSFLIPWLNPSPASAWTGDLPECDTAPFSINWKDAIKALAPPLNPDTTSQDYVIYSTQAQPYAGTGTAISVHYGTDVQFKETVQGVKSLSIYTDTTTWPKNGSNQPYQNWYLITRATDGTYAVQGNGTPTQYSNPYIVSSATCISTGWNATYENTWQGDTYSALPPDQESEACALLDAVCHARKVADTIQDSFSGLLNGIISLVMPSDGFMENRTNEVKDFFEQKLGFLTYPPTFLVNLFQAFTTENHEQCGPSVCTINFGEIYGSAFVVDFYELKYKFPTLWELLTTISRGILVLAVMFYVRGKYIEVVRR